MSKPLILCADDAPSFLLAWKTLLEDNGFRVLTAIDGKEALQIFLAHPVDLVLLDYHMPGMTGAETAEHIRAAKPDIPIALLSAEDWMPESALEAVDAFISKGEATSRLLEIVDHLLSVRR